MAYLLMTVFLVITVITIKDVDKTIKLKLSSSKEWETLPYIKTDPTTSSFSMTIMVISLSVTLFSIFYLREEKKKKEFNVITAMFVGRMITMIFSPQTLSIILG